MGLRGPKPKGKVRIKWSADFAYAIGLLATDGCLLNDGRHIDLTSKDIDQIENFLQALDIDVKITTKYSGTGKKYQRVQFGDVLFYEFLMSIGFTPAKSKTIGELDIPKKYFFDFLRGSFDGDGCFYSYWDPRWRSSHMFYVEFVSASKLHIDWLRSEIFDRLAVKGHIVKDGEGLTYQLKYAKKEALEIIKKMYYNHHIVYLSRKRMKIEKTLAIEKKQQKRYY
ncbi:MAG: hypothetical protein HY228_02015 [Candidatus Yonathbacteria bacterium]|nr:hypothetical protein [Candidatus Yonathbacteria bacterium]